MGSSVRTDGLPLKRVSSGPSFCVVLWSLNHAGRGFGTEALRIVGVPYTDDEIAKGGEAVKGKTELDALIAYLQVMGTAVK